MTVTTFQAARRMAAAAGGWALAGLCLAAPGLAQEWVEAAEGAVARSFPDRNASAIVELEEGTLLQVLETSEGSRPFHRCSVAGGVQVWVHGKYLAETGTPGVLAVTGDRLNMRPMPSSAPSSMPLPDRLDLGARLEQVSRADTTKPLAEDWVRVWAPSSASVWIEASTTRAAASAAEAAKAFRAAQRSLPSAQAAEPAPQAPKAATKPVAEAPAAPQQPVKPGARAALQRADDLFDAAKGNGASDAITWQAVAAAYKEASKLAGEGSPIATVADLQAERAQLRVELVSLSGDLSQRDAQRRARIEQLLDERRQLELSKSLHWGRFDGRGYVRAERVTGQPTRWFLWWAGERCAEIVSGDGRYELARFEGYQVGIVGSQRRAYTPPTLDTDEELQLFDLRTIEVIAGGRVPR
jgi:hypothetical protein